MSDWILNENIIIIIFNFYLVTRRLEFVLYKACAFAFVVSQTRMANQAASDSLQTQFVLKSGTSSQQKTDLLAANTEFIAFQSELGSLTQSLRSKFYDLHLWCSWSISSFLFVQSCSPHQSEAQSAWCAICWCFLYKTLYCITLYCIYPFL